MSNPGAALALAAFALVCACNPAIAQAGNTAPPKTGGESAGMYSRYTDESNVVSRKYLGKADVDVLSEAELMPALLTALDQLSRYRRVERLPRVIRVPHARIEAMVCKSTCSALAAYRSGEGIYLDERLKPETVLFDRSILLHELVHFLQDVHRQYADMKDCDRWYHREIEAYAIQKTFLAMAGSQIRVGYSARESACDGIPQATKNLPPS